jgi:hypothetical protein
MYFDICCKAALRHTKQIFTAFIFASAAISMPVSADVVVEDPGLNHDFNKTPLQARYATQYFSVFNRNSVPVTLGNVYVDGGDLAVCMALGCPIIAPEDFVVDTGSNSCQGRTLQPNEGCSSLVSFVPTDVGKRLARLVFTVNAGTPATRILSGTGVSQPLDCVLDWAETIFPEATTSPTATFRFEHFYARCYQGGQLCVGADSAVPGAVPPSVYLYQNEKLEPVGLLSDYATQAGCMAEQ